MFLFFSDVQVYLDLGFSYTSLEKNFNIDKANENKEKILEPISMIKNNIFNDDYTIFISDKFHLEEEIIEQEVKEIFPGIDSNLLEVFFEKQSSKEKNSIIYFNREEKRNRDSFFKLKRYTSKIANSIDLEKKNPVDNLGINELKIVFDKSEKDLVEALSSLRGFSLSFYSTEIYKTILMLKNIVSFPEKMDQKSQVNTIIKILKSLKEKKFAVIKLKEDYKPLFRDKVNYYKSLKNFSTMVAIRIISSTEGQSKMVQNNLVSEDFFCWILNFEFSLGFLTLHNKSLLDYGFFGNNFLKESFSISFTYFLRKIFGIFWKMNFMRFIYKIYYIIKDKSHREKHFFDLLSTILYIGISIDISNIRINIFINPIEKSFTIAIWLPLLSLSNKKSFDSGIVPAQYIENISENEYENNNKEENGLSSLHSLKEEEKELNIY